jgi:hypothetical protein
MKKIKIICFLLFTGTASFAQDEETGDGRNIIKLNLLALPFKNISVQYERAVGRKFTAAATARFMPKSKLPFRSTISNYADDAALDRQLANTEVGNMAIMPEVRWYVGKKGAFRGFYLGAFANIGKFDADLNYEYDDAGTTKTIPLSGSVNTITGGLMLGAQWKLSKAIYLDWWIAGPNYGSSNGDLSGKQSLSPSEQQSLRDELDDLDIPLTDFTYKVDGNGATIDFKGPWAGVRSGICIGIRF